MSLLPVSRHQPNLIPLANATDSGIDEDYLLKVGD